MRLLAFEDHGELVAAQARQGAALVQAVFQALRHGADQQVADVVAEAVVDVLEVVQIDAQQRAAAAFTFGAGQRLLDALAQQQAVGQAGERVVVGEEVQLVLGALEAAEVGEHRHIMRQFAFVVAHGADVLPLRVYLAALAAVPDFAAPDTLFMQGGPHALVEGGILAAGLEHRGLAAEHVFGAVAGDAREGGVDVHDHAASIGD